MKRRGKKIRWLAVVFAALLFCLTGCFGDASDKEKEKETDTRGRYLETEVKLPEEEQKEESETEDSRNQGLPGTSVGLMLLAGFYLVYTGYKLCSNVLAGEEGASWGFMVAGIAFLVIGAGMLFVSGKNLLRKNKAKKAEEVEEESEAQPEAEKAPRQMSIAERARLAESVAEKEAQEASEKENTDTEDSDLE